MTIAVSNLIRWAGPAAMVAGLSYALVGVFHPPNAVAAITTTTWVVVHILAMATCVFGVIGLVGLYARQAEKSGWLGLAGYLLLSAWLMVILGFTFVEVFILPALATASPALAEGWMTMLNGTPGETGLGSLPVLWLVSAPMYLLGGALFGIATARAGVLSRWAGILLAVGTVAGPLAALLPPDLQPKVAVPVGLALIWLGWSLWSERRVTSRASLAGVLAPAA